MKQGVACLLLLGCVAAVHAQTRNAVRLAFERAYPPGQTYAVVVRSDLPTVAINGARGRERGKAKLTLEIADTGWKQAGSIGREPATGKLLLGEVMKVEEVDFGANDIEMRLQSVQAHEIVRDPSKPENNRREPVVTVLKVARTAGMRELMRSVDGYVRLFAALEQAQAYAGTVGQPQPDRRFTLAVMRRDGILVPFASYDNGHWYNRWPLPSDDPEVPLSLAAVPPDWWGIEGTNSSWTLWTPDGKARQVKVTGTLAFDAHCMTNVGLNTDYKSMAPAPPLEQHHYPKDGLAITGTIPIEPVVVSEASDSMWKSLEQMLRPNINYAEVGLLRGLPLTDARFRLTPNGDPSIQRVAPKLEVVVAAAGIKPETLTVYFEATKRYEASDTTVARPCGAVTFVSGWVHRAAAGQGLLDNNVQSRLTDCTQWNVDFRTPLGVVRIAGKPFWIMQVARWGGEAYEVVEIGDNRTTVVMSTAGGWCKSLGN
ncbi:MAG: hypothetical protein ACM3NQ_22230 [Bacteroidales bacterium]